jgi:hypothetical protein
LTKCPGGACRNKVGVIDLKKEQLVGWLGFRESQKERADKQNTNTDKSDAASAGSFQKESR